jgi:hypothetical protein
LVHHDILFELYSFLMFCIDSHFRIEHCAHIGNHILGRFFWRGLVGRTENVFKKVSRSRGEVSD